MPDLLALFKSINDMTLQIMFLAMLVLPAPTLLYSHDVSKKRDALFNVSLFVMVLPPFIISHVHHSTMSEERKALITVLCVALTLFTYIITALCCYIKYKRNRKLKPSRVLEQLPSEQPKTKDKDAIQEDKRRADRRLAIILAVLGAIWTLLLWRFPYQPSPTTEHNKQDTQKSEL
jgi:amino acid transporter